MKGLDIDRFSVGKGLNRRQAELKQFCDRMPDLPPSLIAVKMSHLSESELAEYYHFIDKQAKNFTAYWKWCFMPKKGL